MLRIKPIPKTSKRATIHGKQSRHFYNCVSYLCVELLRHRSEGSRGNQPYCKEFLRLARVI